MERFHFKNISSNESEDSSMEMRRFYRNAKLPNKNEMISKNEDIYKKYYNTFKNNIHTDKEDKNIECCNNCGKPGHIYSQCKIPITSVGVIAFRYNPNILNRNHVSSSQLFSAKFERTSTIQYLMICRKDTLGYIDFMRGKYLVEHKRYIMNMIKQMTETEKHNIRTMGFNELWKKIWGSKMNSNKYKAEEEISREKFNILTQPIDLVLSEIDESQKEILQLSCNTKEKLKIKTDEESFEFTYEDEDILKKYHSSLKKSSQFYSNCSLNIMINHVENEIGKKIWEEPEWGFPKGRRSYQEKDYECAIREFCEETGYSANLLQNIQNILPFEEIFMGSNYKSYKHKYYLMYIDYNTSENEKFQHKIDNKEVSKMEWKTYEECISSIRYYNIEKMRVLEKINAFLHELCYNII